VGACEQLQDQMMQVLADATVPVARVRASLGRQRWTPFRYLDKRFEDMALLLLLTVD
jgi:hypothetical protein